MKVVLFCGGQGLRMRDVSEVLPKPLVSLGGLPILWHIMKYYAFHGHRDFVLCLGYKGQKIKEFFLNYNECYANDFIFSEGGRRVQLMRSDIDDWRITFVDTGLDSCVGERLWRVRDHLEGEDMFLANYTDGLTDLRLPELTRSLERSDAVATFMTARPNASMHFVRSDGSGRVRAIETAEDADLRVNAGFFVLRREIFEHLLPGEELVEEPFRRLIQQGRLHSYRYDGFWRACDTFKDLQTLEGFLARGPGPWEVWRSEGPAAPLGTDTPRAATR